MSEFGHLLGSAFKLKNSLLSPLLLENSFSLGFLRLEESTDLS